MENGSKLDIVVSAKDEASAALQNIGKTAEGTGTSFLSLSGAVAAGQAALQAFEAAGREMISFFSDSISAAAKASGQMAIVKQSILNAGLSFDEIGPKLKAYSEAMQTMGFDNEETSQSVAKLTLITGSYSDAVKLNQLAMDLARSKGVDLATATTSIAQVMQGAGARALYQYGLNIKDAASTTEILTELQDKVKGSTQAYADSAQGQLDAVRLSWEDIKKEIGNDLMPVVTQLIALMKDGMPVIKGLVEGVADTFHKLADEVSSVRTYIEEVSGKYDHYVKVSDDAAKSTQAVATSFEGIGKATSTALTHAKAIETMAADYSKLKEEASKDLAELSDSFRTEMSSINESIRKTTEEQGSLRAAFNQSAVSDAATVADKIVASEQTIADLKKKIANESDTMKKSQLQGQLDEEQKNYDSSLGFRTNNADAITNAERRAGETQLQRDIEDYNARRALATAEFSQKMNDLDITYQAEVQKKADTIDLYNQRKAAISTTFLQGNVEFKKLSDQRVQITKDEVDAEIKYFQALAGAISGVKGGTKSSIPTISVPVSPRASGGPVSPYMPYLVGEQGPELFLPSSAGTIVPNGGGSSTVNISIGNLYGTDSAAARRFADEIADVITRQLKVRGI